MRDCLVFNNYAAAGGAIHGGSAYGCVISNNVTRNGAYTIRCVNRMEGCRLFVQQLEGAGAMLNCTVTGGGAAVTIAEGENAYTNGTFAADVNLVVNSQAPRIAATNCLFKVPPAAEWTCEEYSNIITNDARFTTEGGWSYVPRWSSPARGKGAVADWMTTATDIRGAGYPRLRGNTVDIGCFRCCDPVGMIIVVQ